MGSGVWVMLLLPAQDHCSHSSRVKTEETAWRGKEKGKEVKPRSIKFNSHPFIGETIRCPVFGNAKFRRHHELRLKLLPQKEGVRFLNARSLTRHRG